MKEKMKRGFTLAELLIVVAIIAVLVAIAIPIFSGRLEEARHATDLDHARSMYTAIGAAFNSGDLELGDAKYITIFLTNDKNQRKKGVDAAADFKEAEKSVSYKGKAYNSKNFPGPIQAGKGVSITFMAAVLSDYGIDLYKMLSKQKKHKWYAVQISFDDKIRSGYAEGDSYDLKPELGSNGIESQYITDYFTDLKKG